MNTLKKWSPVVAIVALLLATFAFVVHKYSSPEEQIAALAFSVGCDHGAGRRENIVEMVGEMFPPGNQRDVTQALIMAGPTPNGSADARIVEAVKLITSDKSKQGERLKIFQQHYTEGFKRTRGNRN